MARAVRFVKAEREFIRLAIDTFDCKPKQESLRDAVNRKLDESEAPPEKRNGLSIREAVTAFQEALARRLVLPPDGANGIYAQMQKRLTALGLSRQDCVTIAKQA